MNKCEEKKIKSSKKEEIKLQRAKKRESKRMGSIANRINWLWIRRMFRMFILFDLLVFSLAAYQLVGWEFRENMHMLIAELHYLYVPVFAIEGGYLVIYMLFGRRGIRRRLLPLYNMAYATQKLTEQSRFDESKFHDLEDAIDKISPGRPDARLATGNSDLQGLENAVNNLMDRMRENYRQQSRFVSDASHELRTPISVIQGYVNMLDRWGAEDKKVLSESIEAIKSESDHMKRMVEQLLFLARGDTGKTQLQPSIFSLNKLLKEVHDEYTMIESEREFELNLPENEVYAVADESMIKQTARILVDNAVKYSPPGEKIILRAGKNKAVPYFSVQDSGVGINSDDVSHVFERFFRSDSSRTRGTGGTGLGLSIAKWIIDKHEGYFELVTREGIGTRISVFLPRH